MPRCLISLMCLPRLVLGMGSVVILWSAAAVADVHAPPVISVPVGMLDFGTHPVEATVVERTLSVSNRGDDLPLELIAVTVEGPDADRFRVDAVPSPLAAGMTGEVLLSLRPGARRGRLAAWLRIDSNDPRTPRVDVGLVAAVEVDGGLPPPLPPVFSHPPGTFADDFALDLTTPTRGGLVVFTTDGRAPGTGIGRPWTETMLVTRTMNVRAATVVAGHVSPVASAGFIRLSNSLRTRTSPLPILVLENFGAGPVPDKGWTTNTQTGAGLRQVRRQPMVMSLHDRLPSTGRAPLLGASTLHSRAGLRVRGAFSSTWSPRPYSLESWDADDRDARITPLGLPAESDWVLYHPHPTYDATMIFNTFIWELSRRTGRYAPAFRHVDVYVNEDGGDLAPGDRRGLYALVEQVKRDAHRIDFDRLSADGTTGGWLLSINRMDPVPVDGFPAPNGAMAPQFFRTPGPNRILQTMANNPAQVGDDLPRQYNAFINFENPGGYEIAAAQRAAIEGWFREFENVLYDQARWRDPVDGYRKYLNTRDFIDYFQLLNLARQGDGLLLSLFPWVSSDDRRLHMGPLWDFNNGSYHLSGAPSSTLYFRQDQLWYPRLFADPDFLMEYIDRWFELRRGPYATASLHEIANTLAAEITTEMASVHGLGTTAWNGRLTSMKNFLVQRANWIDTQYVQPPTLSPPAGPQSGPVTLSVAHHPAATGTLYLTTDGSDPRAPGGLPQANAYADPVTLSSSAIAKARTRTGAGQWSGLATGPMIMGRPASAENLVISEIHYNPPGAADAGEFIEIMNVAASSIDLTGVRFDRGIEFSIPAGTQLGPGDRAIVVARLGDFAEAAGVRILGEFQNNSRLANSGDWLRLRAWDEAVIAEFAWDDAAPWPDRPDGGGPSLILIAPHTRPDPANPLHWRASTRPGGSPGTSDARRFDGDPSGDADGDGINNLAAYALGLHLPGPGPRLPDFAIKGMSMEGMPMEDGRLVIRIPHDVTADDVEVIPEWSTDLTAWHDLRPLLPVPTRTDHDSGRSWLRFDAANGRLTGDHGFLRVRVRQR